jgi:hypothetical protein
VSMAPYFYGSISCLSSSGCPFRRSKACSTIAENVQSSGTATDLCGIPFTWHIANAFSCFRTLLQALATKTLTTILSTRNVIPTHVAVSNASRGSHFGSNVGQIDTSKRSRVNRVSVAACGAPSRGQSHSRR